MSTTTRTRDAFKIEHHPLTALRPHPKNVRQTAVASDDMVASVKTQGLLQPLVVAPNPTLEGDYTIIAGHRRLDALKRAGRDDAPVIVRTDLDTEEKQVAAMLQENLHRQDLTAVEEADAFAQLSLFEGWDVKRIARETGVAQTRVRSRIKLTHLSEATLASLHDGQVTLERAQALAEFAGSPEEELLEKHLTATATNWDFYLARAKKTRDRRKALSAEQKAHEEAGFEVVPMPESLYTPEREWDRQDFESPTAALEAGAVVAFDPDYDAPVYLVKRAEQELETDAAAAARKAEAAERAARKEELERELATAQETVRLWLVDTVFPKAAAGDERILRVAARHLAATACDEDYFRRASIAAIFCPDLGAYGPELRTAVTDVLAGKSAQELAVIIAVATRWTSTARVHAWRDATRADSRPAVWLAMRQELGRELAAPEQVAFDAAKAGEL